jgi:hypothetical protein
VTRDSDSTHPYGLKKGQGSKSDPSYPEPKVVWEKIPTAGPKAEADPDPR